MNNTCSKFCYYSHQSLGNSGYAYFLHTAQNNIRSSGVVFWVSYLHEDVTETCAFQLIRCTQLC